jgi:lipoprotein-anchoring transpeptidase ErfK/SrfK
MGRKTLIATVTGVLLLLAAAIGAYAWDASKADQISEGVRVGDVDVGGLSEEEARRLVRRELVEPLSGPLKVRYRNESFVLSSKELRVRADVEGMVAAASAASREGSLPSRLWRYATGAEVEATVKPRVSYSHAAVDRFVDEIAAAINREPVDASIEPTATSLNPVRGRAGMSLRAEQLRERIHAMLAAGGDVRAVRARAERVAPEVTTAELKERHPTYVVVDRGSFTLRFFEDLKLSEEYTIAVGQQGYDTPAGVYEIESMQVNPTWYVPNEEWAGELAGSVVPPGPENPLKARWMGFYGGAGIHGTDDLASLGTAASHGCIRMSIPDVTELYDRVSVGTPVAIL